VVRQVVSDVCFSDPRVAYSWSSVAAQLVFLNYIILFKLHIL